MTMKLSIKLMAAVAIIAATLTSCGGNASDLFGDLPEISMEYRAKFKALYEAGDDSHDRSNLSLARQNSFEEAAKDLNGNKINISDGEIKITSPVTMTFHGHILNGVSFDLEGEAEAATDIVRETKHRGRPLEVYIVGYDSNGVEVFDDRVGYISCEDDGEKAIIKAGTPVKFETIQFNIFEDENYPKATELKLVVEKNKL